MDFYQAWKDYALVIDLWFNLQAQSPLITIDGMQSVGGASGFRREKPESCAIRSPCGFGMLNNRKFHQLDGSGYEFLSEVIMRLDA